MLILRDEKISGNLFTVREPRFKPMSGYGLSRVTGKGAKMVSKESGNQPRKFASSTQLTSTHNHLSSPRELATLFIL